MMFTGIITGTVGEQGGEHFPWQDHVGEYLLQWHLTGEGLSWISFPFGFATCKPPGLVLDLESERPKGKEQWIKRMKGDQQSASRSLANPWR